VWRALKDWARRIRAEVLAIWLAGRDARVPILPKVLALAVAAYALSPIDLIPDFLPVIGALDDIVLVPLGILAVVRLIPPPLMAGFRQAARVLAARPVSRAGAIGVAVLWLSCVSIAGWALIGRDAGLPD